MIQPNERLRLDYARFEAAGLPSAQLSIVIRRSDESPIVDAALNAAIVKATAEIEALPEVTKVVGPAAIFAEVAPALAGDEPLARFAADDASVTDAYIFALSGGNTEIGELRARRARCVSAGGVLSLSRQLQARAADAARDSVDSRQALREHAATCRPRISGVTVLWANMDNAMSRGQIASVLIMAVACFVTFFLSLRNWTLAASAMFVNVLPVAIVARDARRHRPADRHGHRVHHGHFARHRRRRHQLLRPRVSRPRPSGARRAGVGARPHRTDDDRDLRRDRHRLQRAAGVGVHPDAHVRRDDGASAWCWPCCATSSCSRFSSSPFRQDERTSLCGRHCCWYWRRCMLMAAQAVLKRDATSRRKRRSRSSRSRRSRCRAR